MKNIYKLIIVLICFSVFIFLFSKYFILDSEVDKANYLSLLFGYVVCTLAVILTIFKKEYYMFEPYTIVSLLYISIMILRPCFDIVSGNYYRYGIYVMNGCIKGTMIFIISFIVFTIVYNLEIKSKKNSAINYNKSNEKKNNPQKLIDYKSSYSKNVRIICIILFGIGFISALIYFKTANYNPIMFLKNISQNSDTYLYNSNYKFLMKMEYLMIIPWLYISNFDRNKILKISSTIIMFIILLIGGSRIMLVVCALAYTILPYIVSRKNYPLRKAIILFFILLIVCDILAFLRIGIRAGKNINLDDIEDAVKITDVFDSDLTIYQPYYCIVEKIPKVVPYQMGKGLIGYSIFSFFPRFIFPWKSNFDNMANIIELVMNKTARLSGLATINIGEFYLEFGIFGCIICMSIFGVICRKLKKLYENKESGINELILYSLMFPFLMQIVCRGYLSVQLNTLLFITLPYFIIKWSSKERKGI